MQKINGTTLSAGANYSPAFITRIQNGVARAFRTTRAELLSRGRTQRVACARQVAMYLCRDIARNGAESRSGAWASFPRIGMAFERDHSSVIHAYRRVALRRARDEEFAQMIDELERDLGGGAPALAESQP